MPSSQPGILSATNIEELQDQLNQIFKDVYSFIDIAMRYDGKGVMQTLDNGGLGVDASAFDGLLQITGGVANAVTVGTGLQIAANVLKIKQQAHIANAGAVSALAVGVGADLINMAAFNTALGTLVTEINAIKTKLNDVVAALQTAEILAP